jgi:hypothetical protein
MFALLPILGGLLAGWRASPRTAIALQAVFYVVAVTMITLSAPDHGRSYRDMILIAPALAVISIATLLIGLRLGRSSRHAVPQ